MAAIALNKPLYFVTTTVIDWLDVFTRPQYKHIVVDSLKYCQEHKGLEINAWVLMTNHLHMIVGTRKADTRVGDVMRDFKKYTSKSIVKAISENPQESRKEWLLDRCWFRGANDKKVSEFKFWQDGYYTEVINSYDFYKQKLEYIHTNPVKQEIVGSPEHYLFSSARNYYGGKGLIDVIVQP
jgi:REP element-mobilizing transposase RayT